MKNYLMTYPIQQDGTKQKLYFADNDTVATLKVYAKTKACCTSPDTSIFKIRIHNKLPGNPTSFYLIPTRIIILLDHTFMINLKEIFQYGVIALIRCTRYRLRMRMLVAVPGHRKKIRGLLQTIFNNTYIGYNCKSLRPGRLRNRYSSRYELFWKLQHDLPLKQ